MMWIGLVIIVFLLIKSGEKEIKRKATNKEITEFLNKPEVHHHHYTSLNENPVPTHWQQARIIHGEIKRLK